MINASNEFKHLNLGKDKRDYLEYADVTLKDGTKLHLENKDFWNGGMTFEDAVSSDNSFDTGSAIINKCDLTLMNIDDRFSDYDFDGAEVIAYIGLQLSETTEKLRKGTFTVDETKYNGSIIRLSCLDNMRLFDRPYSESKLEYPASLGTIVRDACTVCGVILQTTTFPHGNFVIDEKPNDEATTFREIISWAAQIAGCFARCDTWGRLELKWYDRKVLEDPVPVNWGVGENLILESRFQHNGASEYTLSEEFQLNEPYTLMIWGSLGSGSNSFAACIDNEHNILANATWLKDGAYRAVVNKPSWDVDYPPESKKKLIVFTNGAASCRIDKIKLEYGIVEEPVWTNAPSEENAHWIHNHYSAPVTSINDVEITKVVGVVETESETRTFTEGKDGYTLQIEKNGLMDSRSGTNGMTIVSWLGDELIGTRFKKAQMNHSSDPTIEAGDIAVVTDRKGNSYAIPVCYTKFSTGSAQNTESRAQDPAKNTAARYSVETKNFVDLRKAVQKEKTDRELAQENLANQLANSSGLYMTPEVQPDESTIYYMHDKPTKDESKIIWKLTANAFGISTDGGKSYPYGLDASGVAILERIYTVGLDATYINTGAITIKDEDGNIMFSVDMDTKKVIISGDSLFIGSQTATDAINDTKNYADKQLADYANEVTKNITDLQAQIDGQIETYYYDHEPTLQNEPAINWTSTEERRKHEGDLFYNRSNGYAYRFFQEGAAWKWQLIQDTDITKALQQAESAQDTADHKRRVFVTTPEPPYDIGDLWANGEDILTCTTSRESGSQYVETDWEKLNTYTDDSALNNFLNGDYKKTVEDLKSQSDKKAETWYQSADPSDGWSEEQKKEHAGDLWYNTGDQNTYIYSGTGWEKTKATPPEEVFDRIDGKAQIFINQPEPPYQAGDLWFNSYTSDIMTCINTKESGDYAADDWEKRNKYTDDTVANQALEEAKNSRALQINLDNDYQGIPVNSDGSYSTFPECKTRVTVYYGHGDVSTQCDYRTETSAGITGSWSKATLTYTVSDLSTDIGWVDITASYLNVFSVTKRFNIAKVKSGAQGVPGTPGKDGTSYYTWIKYADDASGTHMSESPEGKKYIGIATNKPTANESSVASDYTWSLIKGSDGVPGAPGADGKTYYTWIKYAKDANGKDMSDDPEGREYIGFAYNQEVQEESTEPGDYTWSLIKGEDGKNARNYYIQLDANVVKVIDEYGDFDPDVITAYAYYTDGSSTTPISYRGYWKVEISKNRSSWEDITYVESGIATPILLSGYDYDDLDVVRISLYGDASKTNLLDQEEIPVLMDAKALSQEQIFNLLTKNGTIKGMVMSGNQMYFNADYINTGTMVAERIKGGTLTLGGSNNTNGKISILNMAGSEVGSIDNTGVHFKSGSISGNIIDAKGMIIKNGDGATTFQVSNSGEVTMTGKLSIPRVNNVRMDMQNGEFRWYEYFSSAGTEYLVNSMKPSTGIMFLTGHDVDSVARGGVSIGRDSSSLAYALFTVFTMVADPGSGNGNTYAIGNKNVTQREIYTYPIFCSANVKMKSNLSVEGTTTLASTPSVSSDENVKHDILDIDPEQARQIILNLEPKTYKYDDGTSGRTHRGFTVQGVKRMMDKLEIDSQDYATYVIDEDGQGYIRYEEFLADIVSMQQTHDQEIAELKATIADLKQQISDIKSALNAK